MKYPVNEIFRSIQGEATFTGTPCVFVRLQGCAVGCAFCDTKHTWELDTDSRVETSIMLAKVDDAPSWAWMLSDELLTAIRDIGGPGVRHVVITGGEPADYDLTPITKTMLDAGYSVQIETSGTKPVQASFGSFVTVSPKINQNGGLNIHPAAMARADEIKHPCSTERHLNELRELLAKGWQKRGTSVWLQPLSQHPLATERCVEWATEHGFKLSLQTHKYINVR